MKESYLQEPLLHNSSINLEEKNKNPLEEANFLQRVFFTWVFPILKVDYSFFMFFMQHFF